MSVIKHSYSFKFESNLNKCILSYSEAKQNIFKEINFFLNKHCKIVSLYFNSQYRKQILQYSNCKNEIKTKTEKSYKTKTNQFF